MAKLLIPLQGYTQKMAETSTVHLSRSPPAASPCPTLARWVGRWRLLWSPPINGDSFFLECWVKKMVLLPADFCVYYSKPCLFGTAKFKSIQKNGIWGRVATYSRAPIPEMVLVASLVLANSLLVLLIIWVVWIFYSIWTCFVGFMFHSEMFTLTFVWRLSESTFIFCNEV